jgi:hypothetical protein
MHDTADTASCLVVLELCPNHSSHRVTLVAAVYACHANAATCISTVAWGGTTHQIWVGAQVDPAVALLWPFTCYVMTQVAFFHSQLLKTKQPCQLLKPQIGEVLGPCPNQALELSKLPNTLCCFVGEGSNPH